MTSQALPRIVLCVVGSEEMGSRAEQVLTQAGVEHELHPPDPRMREAFSYSACRVNPSLDTGHLERIDDHQCVVYFLSKGYRREEAAPVCHRMMQLGGLLLRLGGLAIKCESSGIAHAPAFWEGRLRQADEALQLAARRQGEDSRLEGAALFWQALYEGYVRCPIERPGRDLYSCGLHLLGAPDVIVADAVLREAYPDLDGQGRASAMVEAAMALGIYLLAECPPDGLSRGETFRPVEGAPRFRVEPEPCDDYEADDFFFNPYGRWRLSEVVP